MRFRSFGFCSFRLVLSTLSAKMSLVLLKKSRKTGNFLHSTSRIFIYSSPENQELLKICQFPYEERPQKKYVTSLFSVKVGALVQFWSDGLQNFRQLRNDALEAFKMSRFFWSDTTEFPYKSMAIRCSL